MRHSPDPYAGQPASQEHQRLRPWRCVAFGSEAVTSWSLKLFFRQSRHVLKLRTWVLGWFLGDIYFTFFRRNTPPTKTTAKPTKGQASTINWVLLGRLSEGTRHQATYSGIIMLGLLATWQCHEWIWMVSTCMYHIIRYHPIPRYLHTIFYHPSNTVPRCRYDRFLVVIMRS